MSPYQLLWSGTPWLGDVPSHWRISRFGYEAQVNGGQVDPREEPWSSMTLEPHHQIALSSGTGRILGRETAAEQGADSGKYLAKAGQILYSKIRPALNKVTIAVEDCLLQRRHVCDVVPADQHAPLRVLLHARKAVPLVRNGHLDAREDAEDQPGGACCRPVARSPG